MKQSKFHQVLLKDSIKYRMLFLRWVLFTDYMFDRIFFYAHRTQPGFIQDHIALFPPFFSDDDAAFF